MTGDVRGIVGEIIPSSTELSNFVKDVYSILDTGDPTQPLYTVPKSSFLPNELSPTPTTKDPIVTVDIGGTNIRITWKHGEDLREFKEPVEDFFIHAYTPEVAIKKVCDKVAELDPERQAKRFGVIYSFPQENYELENGVGAKIVGSEAIQKRIRFLGKLSDGFDLGDAFNSDLGVNGFNVEVILISNDTNFLLYAAPEADTAVVLSSGANALLPWESGVPRNGEVGAFIELPEHLQSPITSEICRKRKDAGAGICSFESVIAGNFLPFELADHIRALAPRCAKFINREFLRWYMEDAHRKGAELVFTLADSDPNSRWYRLQEVDPRLHRILSPSFFNSNGLCAQLSALSEGLVRRSA